jgi:GDP/UDP-N,N'-diacetylbacillosamine 2-epimerase (hydrolysing)
MTKKKIAAITGNRADYDLMSYLYRRLNRDEGVDFGLIVTGAHLLPGYESSVQEMERDGCRILARIADIPEADAPGSRAVAIGRLLPPLTGALETFAPDLLLIVGDREEVPAAALAAAYMKIPAVHFFGGDFVPDGHPDNLARAATSKLVTAHMVALEAHRHRLLAMGEPDCRIHVIGSIALDKYREEAPMDRRALLEKIGCGHFGEYALVIYHPPTDVEGENHEIRNILRVLADRGMNALVSYPNTDFGNSGVIAEFAPWLDDPLFFFYRNFDRNTFVNALRHASLQIGNSSAGVCESASIPLPVVNVGSRNRQRATQENVRFVSGSYAEIDAAVGAALAPEFREGIAGIGNLYGDGRSSEKAYRLLRSLDFAGILLKKEDPLHTDAAYEEEEGGRA